MQLGLMGLGKMGGNMAERLRSGGHQAIGYGGGVRRWLLDLTADALAGNPTPDGLQVYIGDSGENRWTVFEAIDLNVSAPVITESVIRRIRLREEKNFTDRVLAILRNEFDGHAVKKEYERGFPTQSRPLTLTYDAGRLEP